MADLICWPLDNTSYTAKALGAAYTTRSRGILNAENCFPLTTYGDSTVTVGPGVACIYVREFWGAFPFLESPAVLTVPDADGSYPRYDAVVITYDKNENRCGMAILQGSAQAEPVCPVPRRDDNFDEIVLYAIYRPAGATTVTADQVVDLRLNADFCGLMRDTMDHIDTSVIENKVDRLLEQISDELRQLNAGVAAMLRADYDPDDSVRTAGGIKRYLSSAIGAVTVTLPATGWGSSAPYIQTVAVSGMTESWKPGQASPDSSGVTTLEEKTAIKEAAACIDEITSGTDALTFTCFSNKPSADIVLDVPGLVRGGL